MSAQMQIQAYNPEFILTRAVSRGNVFWARVAVYWSMILIPIVIWLLIAIKQPSFTLELNADRVAYYLGMLPGSFVEKGDKCRQLRADRTLGGLWLKLWAIYLLLFAGAIAQLYISVIATLRWRNLYYWTGFTFGIIVVVSGADLWTDVHGKAFPLRSESRRRPRRRAHCGNSHLAADIKAPISRSGVLIPKQM